MKKFCIRAFCVLIIFASMSSIARAQFLTYAEWASSNRSDREVYLAGVFDAMIGIGRPEDAATRKHYLLCLKNSRTTLDQIEQNLRNYGATHPIVQSQPASIAFAAYLFEMCGSRVF